MDRCANAILRRSPPRRVDAVHVEAMLASQKWAS
jgi:hypothetical protein